MKELTRIQDEEHVTKVVTKFREFLLKEVAQKKLIMNLESAMLETFQNMPDHANPHHPSDFEGYANIQSYVLNKGKRAMIACGDLGVGIRKSLQTSSIYSRVSSMTDRDAIRRAVLEKASRYRGTEERDRGGGLFRTVQNVMEANGVIIVRSGTASLKIGPFGRKSTRQALKYFPGTQICSTVTVGVR